jgi:prepilin-type N-terminal cleavage/methylation domain-containing protein
MRYSAIKRSGIIHRLQHQEGFSLLELLVALVIVSSALVAAAELQVASISGNAFSNNATVATRLAQNKMEELKKLSNSDAALTPGDHDEGLLPGTPIFSRSYTVTDLSAEVKQVTVSVSWTDKSQRTITLSTMKAK